MIVKKSWVAAALAAGTLSPAAAQTVRLGGQWAAPSFGAPVRSLPEFKTDVRFDDGRVLAGSLQELADDLRRLHVPGKGARPVPDPRLEDKASQAFTFALAKLTRKEPLSDEDRRLVRHYLDVAAALAAGGAGQAGLQGQKATDAALFIDAVGALAAHDAGMAAAAREAWARTPAVVPAGVTAPTDRAEERAAVSRRILALLLQTFR